MRIGLDFDNTLACYDHIFRNKAKEKGIVSKFWSGNKIDIRKKLRSQNKGEIKWQKLQGEVYGPSMSQATLFPEVANFLMFCKKKGHKVFIVSHKTEFANYDSTKTPLQKVALDWMKSKGFFKKNLFNLSRKNIFFAESRKDKIKKIISLKLDIFIDDLEEVFNEKKFPSIKKILFTKYSIKNSKFSYHNNWTDITKDVLGSITNDDFK